jgi:hypothetical protein
MTGRPAPRRGTSLVSIAFLGLLTAVLLVVFVLRLARSPEAKVQLGTDTFVVPRAGSLQKPIAQTGPLLFQALRGSIDLYVQHLGADPDHGWLAFEAHRPDGPRRCLLQWRQASHDFVDPCDRMTYPAGGQGLQHYAVTVTGGKVIVDLHQATGPTPRPT